MKINKKIIGKIAVLLVIGVICIAELVYAVRKKLSTIQIADNFENIISENEITEETTDNELKQEDETNEENQEIENIETLEKEENNYQEEKTEQTKTGYSQNKETSQVKPKNQETIVTNEKQTVSQEQAVQKPVQTTTSTTKQAVTAETQAQNTNADTQNQTKEVEEKYIRNDNMINNIKRVIENNPSDNMKTYGYTVQVDSSIKERTNQFTYSEERVINFIRYSFGTIRIYAEDYYRNGQLIMTECYIF